MSFLIFNPFLQKKKEKPRAREGKNLSQLNLSKVVVESEIGSIKLEELKVNKVDSGWFKVTKFYIIKKDIEINLVYISREI